MANKHFEPEQPETNDPEVPHTLSKAIRTGWSPSGVSQMIAKAAATQATPEQQKELIDQFILSKQQELDTILISNLTPAAPARPQQSALVSSLIASLLSWNWLPIPHWTAKAAMLLGMLHSLVGLGIASQQSVALSRTSFHPRRTQIIWRAVVGEGAAGSGGNAVNVGSWRHFSWQIPTILLGNSLVFTVVGLAIAVFDQATKATSWGHEGWTAVCFAISMAWCVGCYFVSWACIEWRMQDAIKADIT
ncbi:MAG: hypothetical protein Q9160_006002 [Pyrenula sp. 1 TL-2023]